MKLVLSLKEVIKNKKQQQKIILSYFERKYGK